MNNIVIALIPIALLGGLGGGYSLGYLIHQPQLHNLQNSPDDLNDELHAELDAIAAKFANLERADLE